MTHNPKHSVQLTDYTEFFGIARWRAWTPGISDSQDWQRWIEGRLAPAPDDQPDVSYLPGLLRRRLDRPGRMALHTAWPCVEGLDSVQLVFASRHGALHRTVDMLTALANDEVLSPTLFSLAVHNSTAGLFSIARGDRSAATAMAAGLDTLALSILEGANMVSEGAPNVLVTYTDDIAPEPYREHIADPATLPFAISLLLTPATDASLRCRLGRDSGPTPEQAPETALMRFLLEDTAQVVLGASQNWQLERAHAG
ncbi:MAG: beta-ketoacyl synthase chain length factor [Gammaproteobacteria bacterium]